MLTGSSFPNLILVNESQQKKLTVKNITLHNLILIMMGQKNLQMENHQQGTRKGRKSYLHNMLYKGKWIYKFLPLQITYNFDNDESPLENLVDLFSEIFFSIYVFSSIKLEFESLRKTFESNSTCFFILFFLN